MDLYDELPSSSLIDEKDFELILESARINKVSVLTILSLSPRELVPILHRSINEISHFKSLLEKEYDEYINANLLCSTEADNSSSSSSAECFTTGDAAIDELLGGGIFTENVTEIYGESSTGKSQLLMQLSLSVQLPQVKGGLNGKCVFISTEGDLFTNRVQQIIDTRYESDEVSRLAVRQDNIYYVNCSDLENQQHILNVQLPVLLEKDPTIKLVIIDSISHHIRAEHESHTFLESQKNRFNVDKISANLLKLCIDKKIAIVVANQVSNKVFNFQQYEDNYTNFGNTNENGSFLSKNQYTECEKFDYQLGYIVGWKESNIKYTQMMINFKNTMTNDMLSDDEDVSYLDNLMHEVLANPSTSNEGSNTLVGPNKTQTVTKEDNGTAPNKPPKRNINMPNNQSRKRTKYSFKKAVNTTIPTLGLTWANNITTRILLGKRMVVASKLRNANRNDISVEDLQPEKALVKKRTMKLVFSTFAKSNSELTYSITSNGIECVQ